MTIEITEDESKTFEEIKKLSGKTTIIQIIRTAIKLFSEILKHQNAGAQIIAQYPDKNKVNIIVL